MAVGSIQVQYRRNMQSQKRRPERGWGWLPGGQWGLFFWGLFLWSPLVAGDSGLVFPREEIRVEGSYEQKRVSAVYPFTVQGNRPVQIETISTSCGCTLARASKEAYDPGDSGEIRVLFELEGRQGLQRKTIRVRTDRGETVLVLEAELPVRWEMRPRVLAWKRGKGLAPRTATVRFLDGNDYRKVEIDLPEERYAARWSRGEEEGVFSLEVTPTGSPGRGGGYDKGEIRAVSESGSEVSIPFYLRHY